MEVIILLIYKSSLYILDRSLLSICKISLSFSVLSFHFPDGITDNTKVLNCDETQFTYIFWGGGTCVFGLISKKPLPNPASQKYTIFLLSGLYSFSSYI